jgi:hypothetical protein
MKKNEKNMDEAKIVDIVFDNEGNTWEEVSREEEAMNFQQISEAPEPWYVRILALIFFALAIVGSFLSLVALLIAAPFAFARYISKQPGWDLSLTRWWIRFRRCLVVALSSFVAIFSLRFGLSILMLYFSLYDPLPNLVGQVMGKFSS